MRLNWDESDQLVNYWYKDRLRQTLGIFVAVLDCLLLRCWYHLEVETVTMLLQKLLQAFSECLGTSLPNIGMRTEQPSLTQ